jgi:hypothetical protein
MNGLEKVRDGSPTNESDLCGLRGAQPNEPPPVAESWKDEKMQELHAAVTSETGRTDVTAHEEAYHRFRLLATMVQGTAAALPEAWQSYGNVDEARIAAREMMRNHRVLRVAIVEDRIPMQFVEWVGR